MSKTKLLVFLLFPCLIQSISSVHLSDQAENTSPNDTNAIDFIRTSCSATLYPNRCYSTLARYANAIQQSPSQLALVAVSVSLRKARRTAAYFSSLQRSAAPGSIEPRAKSALSDCKSTFGDAIDLMTRSLGELRHLQPGGEEFQWHMGNAQTWISAALTNEDTCTDGFDEVGASDLKADVCARVSSNVEMTSNALALVNSLASKEGNGEDESEAVDFVGRGF